MHIAYFAGLVVDINIRRSPNRVILSHLIFVLHIQEVSRPLGKNVPEGTACAQMLEVFRHVTCQNDGLCEFFGAFGFLVGLSDMV